MPNRYIWAGAAVVVLVAAASYWWWKEGTGGSGINDPARLAQGQALYEQNCASCHGLNLEGQANWRKPLPNGRLPAPPHDAAGHTWHHPDDILFRITKEGTAAVVGGGHKSDMPGFGNVLTDTEIQAVLAYIKSKWPEKQRAYQEEVSSAR